MQKTLRGKFKNCVSRDVRIFLSCCEKCQDPMFVKERAKVAELNEATGKIVIHVIPSQNSGVRECSILFVQF